MVKEAVFSAHNNQNIKTKTPEILTVNTAIC